MSLCASMLFSHFELLWEVWQVYTRSLTVLGNNGRYCFYPRHDVFHHLGFILFGNPASYIGMVQWWRFCVNSHTIVIVRNIHAPCALYLPQLTATYCADNLDGSNLWRRVLACPAVQRICHLHASG